jgi:hypothetical protein
MVLRIEHLRHQKIVRVDLQAENFAFPILDYDFGPDFDHFNATGVPTNVPR